MGTLKLLLLVAILPHVYIQSVDAFSSLKNGNGHKSKAMNVLERLENGNEMEYIDVPVEIVPKDTVIVKNIFPGLKKNERFVMSVNVLVAWRAPETGKIGSHSLPNKQFEKLREIALSTPQPQFDEFMKFSETISTSEFITLIEDPEERYIQLAKLND